MKKLSCTLKELIEQHEVWNAAEKISLFPDHKLCPDETLNMYAMEKGTYEPSCTTDGYIVRQAGKTWTNNMSLNNPHKLVKLGDYDRVYDKEGEYKIHLKNIIEEYNSRGGDYAVLFYEKAKKFLKQG